MNLLWTPGMSVSARDLGRHLNRREKAALYALSLLFGLCAFGIPMVLMGWALRLQPFHGPFEGFALPLLICLAAGAWSSIALQRRILLASRFARDEGLTLADITARRALSRGDYLVLGGIAATALMIALAGFLFSASLAA